MAWYTGTFNPFIFLFKRGDFFHASHKLVQSRLISFFSMNALQEQFLHLLKRFVKDSYFTWEEIHWSKLQSWERQTTTITKEEHHPLFLCLFSDAMLQIYSAFTAQSLISACKSGILGCSEDLTAEGCSFLLYSLWWFLPENTCILNISDPSGDEI